jgi:lysophospholipase L1-like esterase
LVGSVVAVCLSVAAPEQPRGGAPAQPPARDDARKPFFIAAVGDSLTDAKSGGGKYLDAVRKACPETRIDNLGRGGDMVNQMRRRWQTALANGAPRYTHVIVFGGVNDLYSDETAGRTVAKIEADLTKMYELARERGIEVVAFTVAPWGGFRRYFTPKRSRDTLALNEWIRTRRQAGSVSAVIDAYRLLSCADPERLCAEYSIDGLHFNAAGHAVLGRELKDKVFAGCR